MRRVVIGLLLCAWAGVGAGACRGEAIAPKRLQVVTSILPMFCLAAQVAGTQADVQNLLPPGIGPHDFQYSPREMRLLSRAQILIVNGLGLEPWATLALSRTGAKAVLVEGSSGLGAQLIHGSTPLDPGDQGGAHETTRAPTESPEGAVNPHVWLDPSLACHAVTNILRAFQAADPAQAGSYASNALRLVERLQGLDAEIRQTLAPLASRAVLTYHDAFPYFARRYGLRVVGVIEAVPEVDPTPKYLSALSRVVRGQNVAVIFTEPQFSTKLARRLGQDLAVPIATLDTMETGPLRPEAYEEGMRQNLRVLQKFLR